MLDTLEIRYANLLLQKATPQGECLICHISAVNGYPKLSPNEYAHRFIFQTLCGDIGHLHVLHTCDNTLCINPKHLFLGTHLENMQDKVQKGRLGKVGGKKPRLFTPEEAQKIIELAEQGVSQRKIAAMFLTNQKTVWSYIHHKHLESIHG